MATLDIEKYSGEWYEISRDWWFSLNNADCTRATYTPREDGMVTVLNETYNYFYGLFALEGAAI